MKVKNLSMLAGAGSLLLAGTANAGSSFLGLDVIDFTGWFQGTAASDVLPGYTGTTSGMHPNAAVRAAHIAGNYRTFRIYAMVQQGASVDAVGGLGLTQNTATWMSASSGNFFNIVDEDHGEFTHYNVAPATAQVTLNPSHAFDSFVSIGRTLNDSATSFAPDAATFGALTNNMQGSSWSTYGGGAGNAGWFVAGSPVQGQGALGSTTAGHGNWGVANDGVYRVLLAQITVGAGVDIEGDLGAIGGSTGAGAASWEVLEGLYFNTIPAPGALALLGLAGLAGRRRRA